MIRILFLGGLAAAAPPVAVSAETPDKRPPAAGVDEVDGVVVTGKPRGSVEGDIEPELVLDEAAIRSYGASNIAELLTALEPQTRGSGGGPPVLLINGQRTSGFQDMRGIPIEALERIDIMPEQVALSYGYRPDQRVMNFVLRQGFRSLALDMSTRRPTAGGRVSNGVEANAFKVAGGDRWTFNLEHRSDSALFESERDIVRVSDLTPYDRLGNVTGSPLGSVIDPRLTTPTGAPAVIAGVPVSAAGGRPGLADFAATAGVARTGDLGASRTLLSSGDQTTVGGSVTRALVKGITATVSASLEDINRLGHLGLPGVAVALPRGGPFTPFVNDTLLYRYIDAPDSLTRKTDTRTQQAGLLLLGLTHDWRWTFTGGYDRSETDTRTGRGVDSAAWRAAIAAGDPAVNPFAAPPSTLLAPVAADTAHSVTTTAAADLVLNGVLFEVPAGRVGSTVKLGVDHNSLDAESLRSGLASQRSLARDRRNLQVSLNLPLASRRRAVAPALGELSLNLNAGYQDLSDLGGLSSLGGGVNWTPTTPLTLQISYSAEEGAPTIQQLNDPTIFTPNVSVFDFATGQTAIVTRIEGGNPGLAADSRRIFKLGGTLKPWSKTDFTLNATFTRTRIDDSIAAFPTITADLAAAFPSRFVRDAGGRLITIDVRPVVFAGVERQELRWGLNYTRATGGGAPQRGGGPGGPGGPVINFGQGGGRPGQLVLNFSLYDTWRLRNEVTVRDGLPALDLLSGASLGGGGGQPRHEVQAQGGIVKDGIGARVNATWRASTTVRGGSSGRDLAFSDLGIVSLNLFADLSQRRALTARHGWLKDTRATLIVDNLFDSRQSVRDAQGLTPQAYQRDYLDPLGRTVRVSLRRLLR